MKKILVLDQQDYDMDMPVKEVYTVRGIIWRDGMLAMQQDARGEYKIPGGGMEDGETCEGALAREVLEETGLTVKLDSIEEIGEIEEMRRDIFDQNIIFHRHTYFYSCQVEDAAQALHMTSSELEKGFHLAWARPEDIYETNKNIPRGAWDIRDTEFIKLIVDRG